MKIGFTTTTFRQIKDLRKIVSLASDAEIDCIEWGGDIHIKNEYEAKLAKDICNEHNISVSSYASYYRIGSNDKVEQKRICEIAQILGASSVRVWLGKKDSEKTDRETYLSLVSDAKSFCETASDFGLIVCPECHDNTFNNNTDAFLKIYDDIACDNFKTYFQSRYKKLEYDLERIERTLPYIESVHISFSELRREQFPKYSPEYIDILLNKLCSSGFDGNLLLEYTYLFGRFGIPSSMKKDISKLKSKVGIV